MCSLQCMACLEARLLLLVVHSRESPRLVNLVVDEVRHELVVNLLEVDQRDDLMTAAVSEKECRMYRSETTGVPSSPCVGTEPHEESCSHRIK